MGAEGSDAASLVSDKPQVKIVECSNAQKWFVLRWATWNDHKGGV